MRLKAMVALGLALGLAAMTGASSAQGALNNPQITIQDARLISQNDVLVTGTSNCVTVTTPFAQLVEDNGAKGTGADGGFTNSSNWAVTVARTTLTAFVKGKADVSITANCPSGSSNTVVSDSRTIPVQ